MSPMEEFIFQCIKKGGLTPDKIGKKIDKSPNYINVYARQLKRMGLITTTCPTCNQSPYYKIVT